MAFDSVASNLDPGDKDELSDVFVRNISDDTVTLVGNGADEQSSSPAISADGRYVVYVTFGSDFVQGDIYVRDLQARTTTLVSRSSGGAPANGDSFNPAISADGRYVAFATTRKDLLPLTTAAEFGSDVILRDLKTGKVELVSRASGTGAPADDESGHPSISADGRYVSFHSSATNLATGDDDRYPDVFVRDRSGHDHARQRGPGDCAGPRRRWGVVQRGDLERWPLRHVQLERAGPRAGWREPQLFRRPVQRSLSA